MKQRLSPTIIALAFFAIFDSLVLYGAYLNQRAQYLPVSLSALTPNFTWKAFDGSTHTFKELSGHVVVLHFWASWCPPCREEFPRLLRVANDNKDIIFLTISIDETLEKPEAFVKNIQAVSGITAPSNVLYAWDQTKELTYEQFLVDRYPESIVIGKDGRMRRKYPAPVDWNGPDARKYLTELKGEK